MLTVGGILILVVGASRPTAHDKLATAWRSAKAASRPLPFSWRPSADSRPYSNRDFVYPCLQGILAYSASPRKAPAKAAHKHQCTADCKHE